MGPELSRLGGVAGRREGPRGFSSTRPSLFSPHSCLGLVGLSPTLQMRKPRLRQVTALPRAPLILRVEAQTQDCFHMGLPQWDLWEVTVGLSCPLPGPPGHSECNNYREECPPAQQQGRPWCSECPRVIKRQGSRNSKTMAGGRCPLGLWLSAGFSAEMQVCCWILIKIQETKQGIPLATFLPAFL